MNKVSLNRTFATTPERLFAAWTDPEMLTRWWGPPGSQVSIVEVDLQVGGTYRIGIKQPNGATYFVRGVYEVIKPPQRLAFTWRWEQPDMDIGTSLVTVTLTAQGSLTKLQLTHALLPDEAAQQAHEEGWIGILANLSDFMAS